jgi:Ca2+-binding RTX toxin-like protein
MSLKLRTCARPVVLFCVLFPFTYGTSGIWAQEPQKTEVRLALKSPPSDLPAGRTIVALSRLLGYQVTTAPSCQGDGRESQHVQSREDSSGIRIDSPILSSKGPFENPDPAGCGYGRTIPPERRGSESNDTFILGAANDHPEALGGNDRVDSGEGDDVIDGGSGDDILFGGEGHDTLLGGEGHDNLFGGPGNDRLIGGPGEDVLEGGAGDDVLEGDAGNDTLFGDEGDDFLSGGAGDDVLEGNAGDDTLLGGDGNDELDGGAGDDRLAGGEGDDWLKGEAGRDVLEGGAGRDRLEGQDGPDVLDGGPDDDILDGGDDPDILLGADGDDLLRGGDGDDTLNGGAGADKLYAGDGNDRLDGGAGDDLLDGGDGDDFLDGGAGADQLLGGEGADILLGGAGNDLLKGDSGNDFLDGGADDDQLLGGDGDDILQGGPGNDRLTGGWGADIIKGGDGDDTVVLHAGDVEAQQEEMIDGGPGDDTLLLNGFSTRVISGPPGASGTFVVTDPLSGGAYRVSNVERIRYLHWFSHLGGGEKLASTLLLANPSTRHEAAGRIAFLTYEGQPLELSVGGSAPKSTEEFRLPPLGSIELALAGSGQTGSGRARVESDQPLAGTVRFSTPDLGRVTLVESLVKESFAIPVVRERAREITTGVFVVNGETGGHYELSLRRPTGAPLDETDVTMPPHAQMLRNAEELFPEILDFQGTLRLSGTAMSAFTVMKSGNGSTILPVVGSGRVPAAAQAAQTEAMKPPPAGRTLHLAHFAAGGGAASTLFLINPSTTEAAKGSLEFFDAGGTPLAVPIEGRGSASALSFELGAGGSSIYRTADSRMLVQGSARIRMAEGAAEALLLYGEGSATVGVEPGGPHQAFLAPVKRGASSGITTRLAVSSTGEAAEVTFSLRDADGRTVPGGTASVKLPPNGRVSLALEELFPRANTADFRGAVSATAAGDGRISALGLEQGQGELEAVPVMQLD